MKEKIEQRVIGLFVLMLAILVFVSVSAVRTIEHFIESSDWVNHTHAVVIEVNAVISSLHAGDAALRTYLLTGDRRDQGAYRSAYAEMVEHLETAKALTRSGVEKNKQNQQVIELQNLISNRIDFTRSVVKARDQGGIDAAKEVFAAHPDVESMGKIQRLAGGIINDENDLLRERDKESHLQAQATRTQIYMGVVVNFALLVFVSWLLRDDLAARRKAQVALKEANEQLEAKVKERTAELSKSNLSLKEENLERRWANQALDHQLRYSQLIINSISELVFVISRALNVSRVNPAVGHHTGWGPQDLIAQSLERALQLSVDAAGAEASQNAMTTAMREGRELQNRPGVLVSKNGQTKPVEYSMVPLRDHDKVVGAVVIVRLPSGAAPAR
jgi:PAS domain S-box-containing protein